MIIKSVQIKNYRCVRDETLSLGALTALVGANGAGKSTFLQALDVFYDLKPVLSEEDICHHRNGDEVEIAITFGNLSVKAKDRFAKYLQNDELTVVRVLRLQGSSVSDSYHGARLLCKEFVEIRAASASEAKTLYNATRERAEFEGLPTCRSKAEILAALDGWEAAHPERCTRERDDGQFFGFKTVGGGYLGDFTKFILVPAVRDASEDGTDGKNTLFAELIDLVVRNTLAGDEQIAALNEETTRKYREIIDSAKGQELLRVQSELSAALSAFIPDTDVSLAWSELASVQLPLPKAIARVGEHGFQSGIERKGHGLQRAFIMTLLQYLESARSKHRSPSADQAAGEPEVPDLVLGIEEPELYQHPDRQRHIANVLMRLANVSDSETDPSTQVVYTTHSPHFVGLDRFDDIRLARKIVAAGGVVPTTRLASTTLASLAVKLAEVTGAKPAGYTAETLRVRLQPLMTPWMNEGFFADVVVLVEGEQDRAAILGAAQVMGHDLESMGLAIIPCLGKSNLDRPCLIFRELGIPTYIVWDSDQGGKDPKVETNRKLLRLVGEPEEDYPDLVTGRAASFRDTLEDTLRADFGPELYDEVVQTLQEDFEMRKDDIIKNGRMMAELFRRVSAKGVKSKTLEAIVEAVLSLRARMHAAPKVIAA